MRVQDEAGMRRLGGGLARVWGAGDIVFLEGELGAGKTTLVRGVLAGLGWEEAVRSPTFNLLHVYETTPPVVHADLYRVQSHEGVGLEEYLDDHLVLVEWADRAAGLVLEGEYWRVKIDFLDDGRRVEVVSPDGEVWKGPY